MCTNISFSNAKTAGNLFYITPTASKKISQITLCLNAKKRPISCQNYASTGYTATIQTTIPKHTYPYAGIKIVDSSYAIGFGKNGSKCTSNSNGYCIFSVSDSSPVTIQLVNPNQQLSLYPSTLSEARTNTPYYQEFIVSGGYPPYTWTSNLGTLASYVNFTVSSNTQTATLTGANTNYVIPPLTPIGLYPITITITDSQNNQATIQRSYTLSVNGKLILSPASGTSFTSVPVGSSFPSTNVIVTNATSSSSINYTQNDTSQYPWPPGLTLTNQPPNTATIESSVFNTLGNYTFSVLATETAGSSTNTGTAYYKLAVVNSVLNLYPQSGSTLTPANIDQSSNYNFSLSNYSAAVSPVTYTITNAPPGLTFPTPSTASTSPYTIALSGTPTTIGYYTMTVTATDQAANQGTGTYYLATYGDIDISPSTISNGTVGSLYSQIFSVTNVDSSNSISWTGKNLPAGLAVYNYGDSIPAGCPALSNNTQALLCGTPTTIYNQAATPLTIYVKVFEPNTSYSIPGEASYPNFIITGTAVFTPSTSTISGAVGTAITPLTVNVSNCSTGCKFSSSSLPAGISMATTSNSFTFSGTPTAGTTLNYNVNVSASSPASSGTGNYAFNIASNITFNPNSVTKNVNFNSADTFTVIVSGFSGTISSVTTQGSTPPSTNISFSSSVIAMQFVNQGCSSSFRCPSKTYNFQLLIVDSAGNSASSGTYTITYIGNK